MTIEFSRQEKARAALVEFNNAEEARGARLAALQSSRAKSVEVAKVVREWRIKESEADENAMKDREALEAAEARSAAALKALMEAER